MKTLCVAKQLLLLAALGLSLTAFGSNPDPDPDPDPIPPPSCEGCTQYQRGGAPTVASLEAASGPFAVDSSTVPNSVSGFKGGTLYYPLNTTGTMGAIAIVPGYVKYQDTIQWWGPRLASHGFVVITINTNSIFDQTDSRAQQLGAALDYMIAQNNNNGSPIHQMVDTERLGAMGWSMGGGGALKLATDRPLHAIIPQAPWYDGSNDFNLISAPALILACEDDTVAPVNDHASVFYEDIPGSTDKAYLEINSGDHNCANSGNPDQDVLGKYGVAWMKRFIDFDERYDQFLCGPNHSSDPSILDYRETCNY